MDSVEDSQSLRDARDKANKEARALADSNKQNLLKLKEYYAQADVERAKRDEENKSVVELKKERDALQEQAHPVRDELNKLQADLRAKTKGLAEDPMRLQERVDELEWVQQTEASGAAREKELSKQISDLRKKLPAAQDVRRMLSRINELRKKLREIITKSDSIHAKVQEHARSSEEHHEKMRALLSKAAKLQGKVTMTFQSLEEKRVFAQKSHDALVSDFKKRESEDTKELRAEEKRQFDQLRDRRKELTKQAQIILAEFKAGKKISMEELLILQEAGLA